MKQKIITFVTIYYLLLHYPVFYMEQKIIIFGGINLII